MLPHTYVTLSTFHTQVSIRINQERKGKKGRKKNKKVSFVIQVLSLWLFIIMYICIAFIFSHNHMHCHSSFYQSFPVFSEVLFWLSVNGLHRLYSTFFIKKICYRVSINKPDKFYIQYCSISSIMCGVQKISTHIQ